MVPKDCGNSPKKNFLKDFLIAIAEGDEPFLAEHVSDGIIWENIEIKKVETKSLYLKELPNHPLWKTDQLAVDKIITHGDGCRRPRNFPRPGWKCACIL